MANKQSHMLPHQWKEFDMQRDEFLAAIQSYSVDKFFDKLAQRPPLFMQMYACIERSLGSDVIKKLIECIKRANKEEIQAFYDNNITLKLWDTPCPFDFFPLGFRYLRSDEKWTYAAFIEDRLKGEEREKRAYEIEKEKRLYCSEHESRYQTREYCSECKEDELIKRYSKLGSCLCCCSNSCC